TTIDTECFFEEFQRMEDFVAGAVFHLHRTRRALGHPGLAVGVLHMVEHLVTDRHRFFILLLLPAVGPRNSRTRVADILDNDPVNVVEEFDGLTMETLIPGVTRRVVAE